MKLFLSIVVFIFLNFSAVAQLSTLNNHTGLWANSGSWTSTTQPNPLTNNINDEIDVYGYITVQGDLNFDNLGNNSDEIVIYDTLVVEGNVNFETNAMSLTIKSGGLMIVFGSFSANNKVDMQNGGVLAITGDLTLNGGKQDYVDNGGSLYVDGAISGNGDTGEADAIDLPTTDLDGSVETGEQELFDFINDGGSEPLPITLGDFSVLIVNSEVELQWETRSEENFDYFEIQRSLNGDEFEVIGTVSGNGNSNERINYGYIDTAPLYGRSYYRLNAVDFDGTFEIFSSLVVNFTPDEKAFNVYPNPGNGFALNIDLFLPSKARFQELSIYGMDGVLVYSATLETDSNQIEFTSQLSPGIYIAKITLDNYASTNRIIVN